MTQRHLTGLIAILGIGAAMQAGAQDVIELGDIALGNFAPQSQIEKMWADYFAASVVADSGCDSAPVQLKYRSGNVTETRTSRVTGWTGSCRDGKRDGVGVLATRHESLSVSPNPSLNSSYWSWSEDQGTFVAGQRLGLWCNLKQGKSFEDSKHFQTPGLCSLGSGQYRKEPDGRWHQMTGSRNEVHKPDVYLPARELERESERILAQARAGTPVTPGLLSAEVPDFGDLVSGGRLRIPSNRLPIDLRSKRVAIVLTSRATSELERFKVMRQSLIQVSAKERKVQAEREAFITESDPAQVFAGLTAAIKAHVGSVVAANDLSVLQTGAADYAIVVDWRFSGEFALSPKDYKSVAGCPDPDHPTCRHFFSGAYGITILDRELVVQRLFAWGGSSGITYFYSTPAPYSRFFEILADGFKREWNVDTGSVRYGVDGWLKATGVKQ